MSSDWRKLGSLKEEVPRKNFRRIDRIVSAAGGKRYGTTKNPAYCRKRARPRTVRRVLQEGFRNGGKISGRERHYLSLRRLCGSRSDQYGQTSLGNQSFRFSGGEHKEDRRESADHCGSQCVRRGGRKLDQGSRRKPSGRLRTRLAGLRASLCATVQVVQDVQAVQIVRKNFGNRTLA